MKRRLIFFAIAMAVLTTPLFARVLSYAPYSNRTSLAGFHDRNSRHFVLIESVEDASWWDTHQVVLYDAKGIEEPRVVYPLFGGSAVITAVALYEPKDTDDTAKTPMLLVTGYVDNHHVTLFSSDGGVNWDEVAGARDKYLTNTWDSDFGGPSVQGLTNPVRNGSDRWPFIVSYYQGVYAISRSGLLEPIDPSPWTKVIGQDRSGMHLLLNTGIAIQTLDLDAPGGNRKTITALWPTLQCSGWITDDGSVFLQVSGSTGRFLFFAPNGQAPQFISGPYGKTPQPLETQWTNPPGASTFFAVPTANFEGAWLLQRENAKPTTLSRYTRGVGVQQMWSDVSGPEVEALIAGESGNTLLIQVHRDRSVVLQRPFIDPALAVWRVGDPMPRHYDELYLNEEWNKGFIHVDVDRMKDGEPFVFNSGATLDDGGVITSPSTGGGGDVIQEWGVVRASLRQHLVLPGVARLYGAFDSRWLTDVTIFNPLDTPQAVDVRYIALGEDIHASALRQKTITLQAREIRFVPDVLESLFGIEGGGGALHFIPVAEVNVFGRTYSVKADGGTFGFGMQAIDFYNAASPRFPVTFAGAFPGLNFRTNVLLTDTSGRGTQAAIGAFGVSGTIGASAKTIDAPPGGVLQFNNLGNTLNLFSRDAGGLTIQPTRGSAIATVVAIDNRTNDPTYFPPDVPASNFVRAIPVIGHVDGANNSHFRSDIYLFNPTDQASTVTLEARKWDGSAEKRVSFTLLPREARVVNDALPTLFDVTGLARLRYWSDTFGDGVRVTSRTYTLEDSGATYGSLIPPLNNFQIAAPGDQLEILGITGQNGFRTNIGLVDLGASNQTTWGETNVRILVLDERMREIDSFSVKVPHAGGMQVNDIFGSRGVTPPEAAMVVVQVLNGGLIGAYATLVDNRTNDTTYLAAHLGAKEN
ncbi:MAG TPA: hypothetical protein VEK79_00920 [Thermoanaerobaculia bacterium]|nr:hypothetical protein [Thermoanaerobaculia bacterium]